jgi:undecaprenyl-diphosphatase
MSALTYPEAVVIGALQGVTELFPVSSLGHSVLVPAVIGGRWASDLSVSAPESPYLAFIVGLHVATALALLLLFRADWVRIVRGFATSVRYRRVGSADERLAWLVIVATVPVGLTGLLLEHAFRTTLGKPTPAAVFLTINGLVLLLGERLRRRAAPAVVHAAEYPSPLLRDGSAPAPSPEPARDTGAALETVTKTADPPAGTSDVALDHRLAGLGMRQAFVTGAAQSLALLPGISRSGVTMVAGLAQGLTHEEAARLSFLLATPVILAAGVLKIPDLFGPLGDGIHGQVLAGAVAAFVCAYLAARFLTRWFVTRTLTPFAVYCLVAGPVALVLVNR